MVEIVRPDKLHVTYHSPQGTYEGITVGKQSVFRIAAPNEAAGWQCTSASGGLPTRTAFPMDKIREDLDKYPVVRKPDTVIDSTPVRAYGVEWIQDGARNTGALYIGAKNGLPRRLVDTYPGDNGPVTETIDLYDYGAKITIALPVCK